MPRHLVALTFDFWNTLYSADDGAMDNVRPQRTAAMRRLLAAAGTSPSEEAMQRAYRSSFDAYMTAWQAGRHHGAREQVLFFLE